MYNHALDTFICVADNGSFNKASEKLYISTTAVIKQINTLEKDLNLQLFFRNNQGISLTPAGNSLYKNAVKLISFSNRAIWEARSAMNQTSVIFRIGSSLLNPCIKFMELWNQINDSFPGFKLQIVPFEDNRAGILSFIDRLGDSFDFFVGVCDSKKWLSKCNMLTLGTYKKCIAVPSYHRLAGKKILKLSDLYGETLIMVKSGDSDVNDKIRMDLVTNHPQIKIRDTDHFYDMDVFNECESSGNLLLNNECWSNIHPTLVTIPVDWNYSIPYGLIYPLSPDENIQKLVSVLKKNNQR